MEKEEQWNGYYTSYFSQAHRKGVNALAVLDEQWFDGRTTAKGVVPHISKSSIVLEIACGIGRVSRFVAPHCAYLYCTDILEEALQEVMKNLQEFNNVFFKKTYG